MSRRKPGRGSVVDLDVASDGLSAFQRFVTAAGARLEGRWDDASAWPVACEELAAAWRGEPAVLWTLVLSRRGLGAFAATADESLPTGAMWTADAGRILWCDLAGGRRFWQDLAAAGDSVLQGLGPWSVNGDAPAEDRELDCDCWLAGAVTDGRGPALAIVLGLASGAPVGAFGADLAETCAMLTPVLGLQRRLADQSAAAVALRSECETLTRLSDLRARLAAVTAHELKTPLTSITAYAEVLEKQVGQPGFAHAGEFLRVIRGEADRLLRLVDRLLDSSRRGHGPALADRQPVAAGPLVEDVRRIMAPQAARFDLTLAVHLPAGVPRLEGDADLIRQVLLNLLGNALKFTPAGGKITLTAREDASTVRLAVADSGPGIAPEELRAIFQSFYRTRSAVQTEGVGLGLSIVKEIISLHGGHLDVHSRAGQGSVFGVHLPKELSLAASATDLGADDCDPQIKQALVMHTLRLVAELATARGVALLMPGAGRDNLRVIAALGFGSQAAGTEVPADGELIRLTGQEAQLLPASALLPSTLAGIGDRSGAAMMAPLRLDRAIGGHGLILAARRLGGGVFGTDDLLLLSVLAEILGSAWNIVLAGAEQRRDRDLVAGALTALTGLRRTGVPTADPLALRLLSSTGRRLGMSTFERRLLQYACALHDAGMVLLDPDVVHKPTQLDVDERDHIGRHPQRALDLLGPLVALPGLQAIIRHHHERVDGRGYPEGRQGEAIPLGARILAVVDAFFAMIRSRPWREGLSVGAAVAEIERNAGSQFDERVVRCFLGTLREEGLLTATGSAPAAGNSPRR